MSPVEIAYLRAIKRLQEEFQKQNPDIDLSPLVVIVQEAETGNDGDIEIAIPIESTADVGVTPLTNGIETVALPSSTALEADTLPARSEVKKLYSNHSYI
jgi:hypothetical protein